MDAEPDIATLRTMLEAIGFTISAATAIYNQDGINKFSELKDLSDERQSMLQAKHLITVVRKPSGGQEGHVINVHTQE